MSRQLRRRRHRRVEDGLIADLGHLARASGVQLPIDADLDSPLDALRALWGDDDAAIIRAATAGDDYQIAFTAPSSTRETVSKAANDCSVRVTRIGNVGPGEGSNCSVRPDSTRFQARLPAFLTLL